MKKTILFALLLINQLFFSQQLKNNDSLVIQKLTYKKFILPTSLIFTGLILKEEKVQNSLQKNIRGLFGEDFFSKADDFMQYAPAAQLFMGDAVGFQSEHGYKQKITNLIVSNLMVTGITFAAKTIAKDKRPDDTGDNSFPSGHTAVAFNNATLLFYEYKNSNIWYASSGYLFATATGLFRIGNNRHWAGDVVTGAGIGIAVGTLVSYWNPFNFDNKSNFVAYPVIGDSAFGAGCQFKLD